jgi:hypothetical protein
MKPDDTKTVKAQSLLPRDTVIFFDTEYVVESALVFHTGVEVIFKDTNDGEPYFYGKDDLLIKKR